LQGVPDEARTWTIIWVADVPGSLKWYQALFGQPDTLSARDYFEQILDSDGTVLLCPTSGAPTSIRQLMSSDHGTHGNGLLLFFRSIVIVQVLECSALEADDVGRPIRHRSVYFAPFVRQVSRESRDEFGTSFAACAFEDGFVIHVVGGTLAAGLK
jgi:hypothetical protein